MKNAGNVYEERYAEVTRKLDRLRHLVDEHGDPALSRKGELSWGKVGDMTHIGTKLDELISFLSGSAS